MTLHSSNPDAPASAGPVDTGAALIEPPTQPGTLRAKVRTADRSLATATSARTTWSPVDCPELVFAWSVQRDETTKQTRFPITVSLTSADGTSSGPPDEQSTFVDTTMSSDHPHVTFSMSSESTGSPLVEGVLHYEPGPSWARLTVTELAYPGGSIARRVLAGDPPRRSTAMYFPPSPFDLKAARQCGRHVIAAYDQYAQWKADGSPPRDQFIWKPPHNDGFTYAPPLWTDILMLGRHNPEPLGFVAWDRAGNVFVAFRGTVSKADWYADAQFLQMDHQFRQTGYLWRIHIGFLGVYEAVRNDLNARLMAAAKDAGGISQLYVTGHSMGAAVATLAVADVLEGLDIGNSIPSCSQYNFASPRVGDPDFATWINELRTTSGNEVTTFRVVNTADIVPTLPASLVRIPWLFDGLDYEHVGTPVVFSADYSSLVQNHSMANYMYALENPEQPQDPMSRG